MTTRKEFLETYRKLVIATYSTTPTGDPGWASDPEKAQKFFDAVESSIFGGFNSWTWHTPLALAAFRIIGCTGRFNITALRALP